MKFRIGQEVWFVNNIDSCTFTHFKGYVKEIRIVRDEKNLSDVLKYLVRYDKYGFIKDYLMDEEELFASYEELEKHCLIKQRKMILDLLNKNTKELEKFGINSQDI